MATTTTEGSPTKRKDRPPAIIGVGASAGGIKAFQALLRGVPADTDAAIVLVIHLDPKRPSGVPAALASSSPLPVLEAQEGMALEAGQVYVIPSNATLTLDGDTFHAVSPRTTAPARAINAFMSSLAEQAGHRAVGVVLSGTADDGAEGLRAIKEAGGFTFAQDDSAEFHDMPAAAQATGAVDRVLAPEKIIAAALELVGAAGTETDKKSTLAPVIERLKQRAGIDFYDYKPGTLSRRVRRRMALVHAHDIDAYVARLDKDKKELDRLVEDVLINVTSFFRDPNSFEALRKHVFAEILKPHADEDHVRIWVPGCSTGEEAYSLAMALTEYMEEHGIDRPFKVFATDVDEQAINHARLGIYPKASLQRLSPERRERFFTKRDEVLCEVKRRLRERCIFARHDLLADPPFSRLDLISCRNVLIYFDSDVQRRLMPVFHYALRKGGFLSLGPAETVGDSSDLFREVDRKNRVYRRSSDTGPVPTEGFPFTPRRRPQPHRDAPPLLGLQDEADQIRLQAHAPPGIVVDRSGYVLLILGDPTPYVRPGPGRPETTVDKLVRADLQADLASVIEEASSSMAPVRREGITFEHQGDVEELNLVVYPMERPGEPEAYLVLFERPAPRRHEEGDATETERLRSALFRQRMQHELAMRRLEAVNDELRTSQEEFLSTNEEYQLTNEELETAKEELQSSYEELTTVNDQLQAHTDEVARLYSDLENILDSLQVPILIVDQGLAIQRITDPGHAILRAIAGDVERSLDDLRTNLVDTDLSEIARTVVDSGKAREEEVKDVHGAWHMLRVRPYATKDGRRDGAVISLLDIDAQKRAAIAHQRARELAETVIEVAPAAVLLLDAEAVVVEANDAFLKTFECDESAARGHPLFKLCKGRLDIPTLRQLVARALQRNEPFVDVVIDQNIQGLGRRTLVVSGRTLPADPTRPDMLLVTIIDETERRNAARELDELRKAQLQQLADLNQFKADFIGMAAHEMAGPLLPLEVQMKVIEKTGKLTAKQADAIAMAKRKICALHLLVSDMRAASSFQSGKLELEVEALDFGALVEEVCRSYEAMFDEADILLEVSTRPVEIEGDAHHLERVVSNLLSNALKYTPAGGRVDVKVDGDDHATLRVRDTGLGFTEDALQKVFQPFVRLHQDKTSVPGTGLGLYLCNGVVELHGGTMEVESPGPGKGSTFTVTLP